MIRKHGLSMSHIESRPSKMLAEGYDFFVDFEVATESIKQCVEELKTICSNVQLLSKYGDIAYGCRSIIFVPLQEPFSLLRAQILSAKALRL